MEERASMTTGDISVSVGEATPATTATEVSSSHVQGRYQDITLGVGLSPLSSPLGRHDVVKQPIISNANRFIHAVSKNKTLD